MSQIRALEENDISDVAALFERLLRKSGQAPTIVLEQYLRELFLDGPFAGERINSRVFLEEDGRVGGFIGVTELPMTFGTRTLRAAVCSALMVQDRQRNPFVGARLLKTVIAGTQDVTLSETASDLSATIWRRLGGREIPGYSLDWIRLISPARYALHMIGPRLKLTKSLLPLAALADFVVRRRSRDARQWSSVPTSFSPQGCCSVEEVDDPTFAAMVYRTTTPYSLRPAWSQWQLRYALEDMRFKSDLGQMVRRIVKSRDGTPIGGFIYYVRRGGVASVLQILAEPVHAKSVFEALLADADRAGAIALRGRSQPWLLGVLMQQRCIMFNRSSSVVHSQDPNVLAAFERGDAFFNGLSGESWTRLFGDGFLQGSNTHRMPCNVTAERADPA